VDLLRAENERLKAELVAANTKLSLSVTDHSVCDRVLNDMRSKLATANERAATLEREIDRLRLQPGQPVATFDGKEWRVKVGDLDIAVATLTGKDTATIQGWRPDGMMCEFAGRNEADIVAVVNALLAFRGIRVQE
jgi:uncharacterized small protein (DUF1192 family)